jgi:SAM-dependent methyltransferase
VTATGVPFRAASPDDPEYVRLSAAEAEFWRTDDGAFLEQVERTGADSPFERHTNRRFTGDERTRWFETLPGYGRFVDGLTLGTSGLAQDARILETNSSLTMTYMDLSEGSLAHWRGSLGRRFGERVAVRTADLNFAELPEKAYDIVVSSSTLHHVLNLEHMAASVNRALRPGGLLFVQDYTGENQFQFSEQKKRIFEYVYNRDVARHPGRRPGVTWLDEHRSSRSPFCGMRSAEIVPVLDEHLARVEVRTAETISGLLVFALPADGATVGRAHRFVRRALDRARRSIPVLRRLPSPALVGRDLLRDLFLVDEIICDAGLFPPMNTFGIWRKRSA